jgi:hypothetical protein
MTRSRHPSVDGHRADQNAIGWLKISRLVIILAVLIAPLAAKASAVSVQLQANPSIVAQGAPTKLTWSSDELSPNFGDDLRVQAAAVWDCEAAGLVATSMPSVNLTP